MVVKDVEPYAIVGGSPARMIRMRFDGKTIERLMVLKWWELPLDRIKLLPFHDVERCLEAIG